MQIKLITDNFTSDLIASPVRGKVYDLRDDFAQHLVDIGVAMALKVETVERKKAEPSSVSQAAPVSQPTTASKRRGRPRKSSQSTTAGE